MKYRMGLSFPKICLLRPENTPEWWENEHGKINVGRCLPLFSMLPKNALLVSFRKPTSYIVTCETCSCRWQNSGRSRHLPLLRNWRKNELLLYFSYDWVETVPASRPDFWTTCVKVRLVWRMQMQERKNCLDGSCVFEAVTKKEEWLQDEEERRPRQGSKTAKKRGSEGKDRNRFCVA